MALDSCPGATANVTPCATSTDSQVDHLDIWKELSNLNPPSASEVCC
jgi:hypothetical protein